MCGVAEHGLLAPVRHLLVERAGELPEGVREHLRSPQLHAATNVVLMGPHRLPALMEHLLPREFLGHSLIEALAAGQLFTPPVRYVG